MNRKIVDIDIVRTRMAPNSLHFGVEEVNELKDYLDKGWELKGDLIYRDGVLVQMVVKYEEEKKVTSMNLHTVTFKLGKGTPKQFAEGLLDDNPAVLGHNVSIGRDSTWEATIIFDADKANTDFYRLLDWIKS